MTSLRKTVAMNRDFRITGAEEVSSGNRLLSRSDTGFRAGTGGLGPGRIRASGQEKLI